MVHVVECLQHVQLCGVSPFVPLSADLSDSHVDVASFDEFSVACLETHLWKRGQNTEAYDLSIGLSIATVFAPVVSGTHVAVHSTHSPGMSRLCSRRMSSDSLARCVRGKLRSTSAVSPFRLFFAVFSFFNAVARSVASGPEDSTEPIDLVAKYFFFLL